MESVSIRDLRNHGGDVIERVLGGQTLEVTRDGSPVATLAPLPRRALSRAELLRRFRHTPPVDPARLRADVDAVIDQSL